LGWGFKQIDMICFTHFHGDHISGLPGLLLTMANADRTEPLRLVGPQGLATVVNSLCVIARDLPFPLEFLEWPTKKTHELKSDDGMLILRALPVYHRMPCFAYSLELLRRGKFDPERARALGLPVKMWGVLQKQADDEVIMYDGKTLTQDMVLGSPRKGLKVAFCTDSRPVPALADFARGADLFVCEGLYGDDNLREKAADRRHMVFSEAAEIARAADVKELWLTHFSPSLPDPWNYLDSATDVFPNTKVGKDRKTVTLKFVE